MEAAGFGISVCGMATALVKFCDSVASQITFVVNFPGDCRKLHEVVQTVRFVADSAWQQANSMAAGQQSAWQQADSQAEGWLGTLKLLREAVHEVQMLCEKCEGMHWFGRFFCSREMSRSIDCIINRLQLALVCVPIQQNQLLAQKLEESLASVQQDLAAAVRAAEHQLDNLQRQLVLIHMENSEALQKILALLLFMLQGYPGVPNQVWQQQMHPRPPQIAAPTSTHIAPQLTAGAAWTEGDALSVLLSELTQLRDKQPMGAGQSADGNTLAGSIMVVETFQHQPGPWQPCTLYPDIPALDQPGSSSSSSSSSYCYSGYSTSTSSSRSSRSPSPTLPPTPEYQPSAAVTAPGAVSKGRSLRSTFSRLWIPRSKRQGGLGATSNASSLPATATTVTAGGRAYAAATAPPAAATAPNNSPGMSLIGLTQSLTSPSDSYQLPGDLQAVLDTAKQLPNSSEDWQAFGRAVQLSLCGEGGLSMNLMGQQLTDEHLEALAQWSAPFWPMLQQLDLSGNCITGRGVQALAEHAAQHWHRLESLALDGNSSIGDSGIKALIEKAAPLLPLLHTLRLGSTGMGDTGAAALSASAVHWPRLTLLGLGHNCITERGLVGFTQVLQQGWWVGLRQLHLEGNAFLVSESAEVAELKQAACKLCKMHKVEEMLISV